MHKTTKIFVNYLVSKKINNVVFYNINFNDKTFRISNKESKSEIFIGNYCKIDKFDENYRAYKNFYNKILPHYFRDFLGCE